MIDENNASAVLWNMRYEVRRSVMDGDYMNALIYGTLAVAGIIGVCKWYKVNYQVDYVGDKGIIPKAKLHVAKDIQKNNFDLFRTMEELLEFISKN